jgi:hypothetical protein
MALYTEGDGLPSDQEVAVAAVLLMYGSSDFTGIDGELSRDEWILQVNTSAGDQWVSDEWTPPLAWSKGKQTKSKLVHTYERWLNCRDTFTLNEVSGVLGELGHQHIPVDRIK